MPVTQVYECQPGLNLTSTSVYASPTLEKPFISTKPTMRKGMVVCAILALRAEVELPVVVDPVLVL
jgi:hypothetical protein